MSAPLRRVQNPRRVVIFAVVTVALVCAGFIGGTMVRSPADDALLNVDETVEVLAQVEERVVSSGFSVPAIAVAGNVAAVHLTETPREASSTAPQAASKGTAEQQEKPSSEQAAEQPEAPASTEDTGAQGEQAGAERAVVSQMTATPGAALGYGMLIGEVSGRPVFAWPPSVPLFRDVVVGDRGADVRAIQQTLRDLGFDVTVDGIFGAGSLEGMRALYRKAGYDLAYVTAGVQGVSWRELIGIPTPDGVVDSTAPVGSLLSAEAPLIRVRTTPPALEFQATAVEIEQIAVGGEVGIYLGSAVPVQSTIVAVGDFVTNEETGASGYAVRVALPEGLELTPGEPIQVRPWAQPEAGPAVPTGAVRQDGVISYVLVRSSEQGVEEADRFQRVEITITAQAEGWVAFDPVDSLPVGADVKVSS